MILMIQLQLPIFDNLGHFISSLAPNKGSSELLSVLRLHYSSDDRQSLILLWFLVITQFHLLKLWRRTGRLLPEDVTTVIGYYPPFRGCPLL